MAESNVGIRTECGTSLAEFNPESSNDHEGEFQMVLPRRNPLIVGNTKFRPITDFELSEEELDKARIELGETDEKRRDCFEELKEMLTKGNIRCRTDNAYLIRYLRFRKFDCRRAYNSLKASYHLKKNAPELFNVLEGLESRLDANMLTVLPYTDAEGHLIFWIDFEKWNPEEESVENAIGTALCIDDVMTMNPRTQVNGVIGVWVAKSFSAAQFSHLFRYCRTLISIWLDAYPWRVKSLHVVNAGSLMQMAYNILRPFLSRKIKDRIFLHGSDFTILHEYINPEILPKKYGGKLEEEECSVSQIVYQNLRFLQHERSFI